MFPGVSRIPVSAGRFGFPEGFPRGILSEKGVETPVQGFGIHGIKVLFLQIKVRVAGFGMAEEDGIPPADRAVLQSGGGLRHPICEAGKFFQRGEAFFPLSEALCDLRGAFCVLDLVAEGKIGIALVVKGEIGPSRAAETPGTLVLPALHRVVQ